MLTPYQYQDASGTLREVSPYDVGVDTSNGITDATKEAMASLARRLHRKYALIHAIAAMYDAGEREEMCAIIRLHTGGDIRCV